MTYPPPTVVVFKNRRFGREQVVDKWSLECDNSEERKGMHLAGLQPPRSAGYRKIDMMLQEGDGYSWRVFQRVGA
jgi:hypothetical protein